MPPSLLWCIPEDIWYRGINLVTSTSQVPSTAPSSSTQSSTASSSSSDNPTHTMTGDNPSVERSEPITKPSQSQTEADWAYDRMVQIERTTGRNDWSNYDVVQEHFDMDVELLNWVVALQSEKNKEVEVTLEYLSQNMPNPKAHSSPPMSDEDVLDLHAIIMYERVVRMVKLSEAEKWRGGRVWENIEHEASEPTSITGTPRRRKGIGKQEPPPAPKVFCLNPETVTKDALDSVLFGNQPEELPLSEYPDKATAIPNAEGIFWLADAPSSSREIVTLDSPKNLENGSEIPLTHPNVDEFKKRMAVYYNGIQDWEHSLFPGRKRKGNQALVVSTDFMKVLQTLPATKEAESNDPPMDDEEKIAYAEEIMDWSGGEGDETESLPVMEQNDVSTAMENEAADTTSTLKKPAVVVESTAEKQKKPDPSLQTKTSPSTPDYKPSPTASTSPVPGSVKRAKPLQSSPKTTADNSKENTPTDSTTPTNNDKDSDREPQTPSTSQHKRRRPPRANPLISVGKVGTYDGVWSLDTYLGDSPSSPSKTPSKSMNTTINNSTTPSTKLADHITVFSSIERSNKKSSNQKGTSSKTEKEKMALKKGKCKEVRTPKEKSGSKVTKPLTEPKKRGRPTKAAVLAKQKEKAGEFDWEMDFHS